MAIAVRPEAIVTYKGLKSPQLKHAGKTFAFVVGQNTVTAAGQDDDRRVVETFSERRVNIECGNVLRRVTADEV